ncbi:MAG TPA: hypothetical protein VG755_29780 [Nannocystaceae bacterium]|nr:hypothetical protein [Nannocystaceae bacterium]
MLDPEIIRPLPDHSGAVFGWIALFIGLLAATLIVVARRRARRRGQPVGIRTLPGGTAVGNALLDLGSLLQPDRPDAAVIRRLDEETEQDGRGDGRNP